MSVFGIIYVISKLVKHPHVFLFGADAPGLFYGNDNLSVMLCIWFALANSIDLLYGVVFYRTYMGAITAYVHHPLFIWLMYFAPTSNGFFVNTAQPFSSAFCIMLIEEIPTFLLALGILAT
jgi:hypothetical protein